MGRPSTYNQETAERICAKIIEGKSLRTICAADDMPEATTVFNWLNRHPEFVEQYARAKEEQAEAFIEEMHDIADDGTNDWMEVHDKDGACIGYKLNGEHVQRSKLRIDTRKWIASKLKAKKYGDSTTLKGDKENPLVVKNNVAADILESLSAEQLEDIKNKIIEKQSGE